LGLLPARLIPGEVPGWHVVGGALLILGGVALAQRPAPRLGVEDKDRKMAAHGRCSG
jgi:drug/metabolite transporter (DMT)-like permease